MNRYQQVLTTTDFVLRVFDHPEHEAHEDPDVEVSTGWGIAYVRRGGFSISIGGERRDLRAGSLFLTRPGLTFRCSHDAGCADDVCVSIALSESAVAGLEDAWTSAGGAARVNATPRLAFVQRRLEQAMQRQDAFRIESAALQALDALASDTVLAGSRGRYASNPSDVDAVAYTCATIDADAALRRSIGERAEVVGMSGPQLTRAFRRFVGLSPHQYVLRRRLAAAAELLSRGHTVSEACYDSGFENLSHFVRSFQRAFGVRASAWAALSARESRRKVQDFLRGGS